MYLHVLRSGKRSSTPVNIPFSVRGRIGVLYTDLDLTSLLVEERNHLRGLERVKGVREIELFYGSYLYPLTLGQSCRRRSLGLDSMLHTHSFKCFLSFVITLVKEFEP